MTSELLLSTGDLTEQIRQHEGLRLKPYLDSVGKLSIGYGRNLSDRGIRLEEAEAMLKADVVLAMSELRQVFPGIVRRLNPPREAVLVDMVFNMGMPRFQTFKKMIAGLRRQDYETAADEMLDSKWARQVKTRADRLALQMRTGEWQT